MSEALDSAIERHRAGDVEGARQLAFAALDDAPHDSALLHFLGMVEGRAGRTRPACLLLERAILADHSNAPALVSLARLLVQIEDWQALGGLRLPPPRGALGDEYLHLRARALGQLGKNEAAATDLLELSRRRPDDPMAALAAARALADVGRFIDAEAAYRRMIERDAADRDALLGLVGLLESLNRPRDLEPLFACAREASADPAIIALGDAIALREARRFAEALVALEAARPIMPEASWQQMRGAIGDRLRDPHTAFSAFAAMNAADHQATPEAAEGTRQYLAELDAELGALDMPRLPPPPTEARAAPVFLLGYPRSGTTLLDTFLMGHRGVRVHEERMFLEAAGRLGGSPSARTSLGPQQIVAMRAAYWQTLDSETDRPDLLQIDKNPLATARAPLIHALFPEAPILFMLRHPCDVVLSCFITRFQLNWGVAPFLRLDDTVAAYDRTMRIWVKARERCRLQVHEIRYEELISCPESTLRAVAAFAGVDFDPAMLHHTDTARARGHIATPSHAQVTQPIYRSSAGRWKRYHEQLAPYLPLLRPWCEQFGYSMQE